MNRAALLLLCATWPALAHAGQEGPAASNVSAPSLVAAAVTDLALPFEYDGPPPPELPATLVRDAEGKTTVRAVRVAAPLRVDGLLDEALYRSMTPLSDFIQSEPQAGAPATEKTEVWISFDDEHVYVSMRASESQPGRMVVSEMRRDSNQVQQNENFAFALDTFYDRRNSFNFVLNPMGGRLDGQNNNEGTSYNGDWNPIWNFAVRRSADGWTAEAAIPFKSIRYRAGRAQIWGLQLRRTSRWKNEYAFLTHVPDGSNQNGLSRMSSAATLVGIEAPPTSRPLDIKPYATSNLTSDMTASPQRRNDPGADYGFDVKYGLTQGLTADLTYNTDFAQVEADEQQVNLTRYSLFFPEKRDFFLENQGLFNFGSALNWNGSAGDTPVLFYSRRIGLDQGSEIPVDGGARVTGRVGRYSVGLLDIQSSSLDRLGVPSTNFAVARVRRDILRRSAIGAIATRRSSISGGDGSGQTYGVDGMFSFFSNLTINSMWARTETPGRRGQDTSYRARLDYNGDRYGLNVERMGVGANFNPEVGFVKRVDYTKSHAQVRFSPRPARIKSVRKFIYQANWEIFENAAGHLETREMQAEFQTEFQSSDKIQLQYTHAYELLPEAFGISRGVTIPSGGYDIRNLHAQFNLGQQRAVAGNVFADVGSFYGGDRMQFGYQWGRVKVSPRVALEPGLSINRVTLPYGEFTSTLVSSRLTYTITPMMFVSTLMQYNSSNHSLSTNARLRWEYLPGSEFFVVYSEGRDTHAPRAEGLQGRTFVVKLNRLLRF